MYKTTIRVVQNKYFCHSTQPEHTLISPQCLTYSNLIYSRLSTLNALSENIKICTSCVRSDYEIAHCITSLELTMSKIGGMDGWLAETNNANTDLK